MDSRLRGNDEFSMLMFIVVNHVRYMSFPRRRESTHNMTITKQPCVYILASQKRGTLYIGVTSHLIQRIWQHKQGLVRGFTDKYHVHMLVYYEIHESMESAILREKQMKKWNRAWKINLIEKENADWQDLWDTLH